MQNIGSPAQHCYEYEQCYERDTIMYNLKINNVWIQ